jgi:hypothetical protein
VVRTCQGGNLVTPAKLSSKEFNEGYEIGRDSISVSQQLQSPWHRRYKCYIAIAHPKELWKYVKRLIQIVQTLLVLANVDTARDPSHPYYDEKSANKDEPTWYMVDVKFVRRLKRLIPLKELQEYKEAELKDMVVVGKGRLSVQPVRQKEWDFILTLEDKIQDEE